MNKEISKKLDALRDLQKVFERMFKIENEKREMPRAIDVQRELLVTLRKQNDELRENYNKHEQKEKELKFDLRDVEDRISHNEEVISTLNAQKEYEVLQKQIEEDKNLAKQLRNDSLNEGKAAIEFKDRVEKSDKLVASTEADLRAAEEKLQSDIDVLDAKYAELLKKEEKFKGKIDEDTYSKFKRIIKRNISEVDKIKKTISIDEEKEEEILKGIVNVAGKKFSKKCTACNMILTQQFVNNVIKGDEILYCPYCSRILFYDEALDEEDADEEDSYIRMDTTGVFGDDEDFEERETEDVDEDVPEDDETSEFEDNEYDDENEEEEEELLNEEGEEFGEESDVEDEEEEDEFDDEEDDDEDDDESEDDDDLEDMDDDDEEEDDEDDDK